MSNPETRKSCIVPKCLNTTTNAPEKLFFIVPFEPQRRKKWMQIMNRADPPRAKSCVYCCEDHFDIESDMESYLKYRLVGGRIKLKKGVVPHKFECQKPNNVKSDRSAVHKRNQIKFIEKLPHKDNTLTSVIPEEVFVAFQEDKKSIKKSTNHKAVQVKLRNKVGHKATITEETYFKQKKTYTVKKTTMQYKQLINTVSISSSTDSSSIRIHDIYEKDTSSSE